MTKRDYATHDQGHYIYAMFIVNNKYVCWIGMGISIGMRAHRIHQGGAGYPFRSEISWPHPRMLPGLVPLISRLVEIPDWIRRDV